MENKDFEFTREVLEQIGYERFWEQGDLLMAYGQLVSGIALEPNNDLIARLSKVLGREVQWGRDENSSTLREAIEKIYGNDLLFKIRKKTLEATESVVDSFRKSQ